ncbi:MAG TPA: AtpZ/AtpI family protein [Micromonosporaceae bacterium]|jgi:F0F1-type ATP synthase assembly protein I
MGGICALLLVGPMVLGWVVDTHLQTLPVFTLIGLLVGILAAARYTYVAFRRFLRD